MYWESKIKEASSNLDRALEIAAQREREGQKLSALRWLEMAEAIEKRIEGYKKHK